MKSNCKAVKNMIREHILEYYSPEELKNQVEYLQEGCRRLYPTNYDAVYHMVEGGSFMVYNHEIIDFLDSLGINSNNKKYDPYDSFKLYCHLIARDADLIIKKAS